LAITRPRCAPAPRAVGGSPWTSGPVRPPARSARPARRQPLSASWAFREPASPCWH